MPERSMPKGFVLFVGFLTCLSNFAAVFISPALSTLSQEGFLTPNELQNVLSLYLLGYVLGQFPYGPISARYGRRPALYVGLIVMTLGGSVCLLAEFSGGVIWLLVGRFLMGLGSASGYSLGYMLIKDVYEGEKARKTLATMTMISAFIPAISAITGSYLALQFSPFFSFICLTLLPILLTGLSAALLPETLLEKDRLSAISMIEIKQSILGEMRCVGMVAAGIITGLGCSFAYLFAGHASSSLIEGLESKTEVISFYPLFLSLGFAGGGWICKKLAKRPLENNLLIASYGLTVVSVLMYFFLVLESLNFWTLLACMFFLNIALGALFPNAAALALNQTQSKSTGMLVFSLMVLLIQAIMIQIVNLWEGSITFLLPVAFLTLSALILAFSLFVKNRKTVSDLTS